MRESMGEYLRRQQAQWIRENGYDTPQEIRVHCTLARIGFHVETAGVCYDIDSGEVIVTLGDCYLNTRQFAALNGCGLSDDYQITATGHCLELCFILKPAGE
jgi:hypothetical protein